MPTAKFIEIFCLNNLFLDADIDKTGKEAQVSLIAPKWHIIGNRKIILNGVNASPYAYIGMDGKVGSVNGEHGKPGKPGISAGRVLCIGNTFLHSQALEIHMNGGNGGSGQHGGKGLCVLVSSFIQLK